MKKLIFILLFLTSLITSAKDYTITLLPSNLIFNTIDIDLEQKVGDHSLILGVGIPVWMSTINKFGIRHSDYSTAKLAVASLRIGYRKYIGHFYLEPYLKTQDMMTYCHIQIRQGWPTTSTMHTAIYTENMGVSIGYRRICGRFIFSFYAGPEVGWAEMKSISNSYLTKDADWMVSYFVPHKWNEALPANALNNVKIHREGNRIYSVMSPTGYPYLRMGFGIGFLI